VCQGQWTDGVPGRAVCQGIDIEAAPAGCPLVGAARRGRSHALESDRLRIEQLNTLVSKI